MGLKPAIMKSKVLEDKAKNIFGDMIDCAYVTTYFRNSRDLCKDVKFDDEILSDLVCSEEMVGEGDDNCICYDSLEIWIKFTNGKTVCFHNSEWGSIGVIDDEVVVEVEPIAAWARKTTGQ